MAKIRRFKRKGWVERKITSTQLATHNLKHHQLVEWVAATAKGKFESTCVHNYQENSSVFVFEDPNDAAFFSLKWL